MHAYHVEGAGGGHAPDVLELAGVPNIIPSSTTPTIPYTVGAHGEHFAMTALIHGVRRHDPSEAAALDDRLRRETMAAEDVLHDMGAIPIINSDSQGKGRIGEVICRTWQLAHKMKAESGNGESEHDNERVLRYIAKYTINPALAHGISDYVGSIALGKMADIVLWRPEFFGIKPELVIKGGFTAWGPLGEGNASVGGSEPVAYGPQFGGSGEAPPSLSALFVSGASLELGLPQRLRSARRLLAVRGVRGVRREHMVRNRRSPEVRVDTRERVVTVDGEAVTSEAVAEGAAQPTVHAGVRSDQVDGSQSSDNPVNGCRFGRVLALTMLAMAAWILPACAGESDAVRIGTEGTYPPFNFINEDGEIDGFEREFADELCERADLECSWVTNKWDTIISNLVDNKYDVIIAGMYITDERG